MGGILTNVALRDVARGLYAAGECASVGIHGANRLGSNSLVEILVFGKVAGVERRRKCARALPIARSDAAAQRRTAEAAGCRDAAVDEAGALAVRATRCMTDSMEAGVGIYREQATLRAACEQLAELRARCRRGCSLDDRSRAFNTEWLSAIELLQCWRSPKRWHTARSSGANRVARTCGWTASRQRDDDNFLKHSLARSRRRRPAAHRAQAREDHAQCRRGCGAMAAPARRPRCPRSELGQAQKRNIPSSACVTTRATTQPRARRLRRCPLPTTCRCCRGCSTSRTISTAA